MNIGRAVRLFVVALLAAGCASEQVGPSPATTSIGSVDELVPETLPVTEPGSSVPATSVTSPVPNDDASLPMPESPRLAALNGRITPEGEFTSGEIVPFVWPYSADEPFSPETLAEIVVYGPDNLELHRRPFNVGRQIGDVVENVPWVPGLQSVGDARVTSNGQLMVYVTYPAYEDATAVAVELDGIEVWREQASESTPTVSLTVDGSVIDWSVEDADGDPVKTTVYYLINGWDRVEVVGGSNGGNRIDLNQGSLVGSEAATVVIFTSDGFNHATATATDIAVRQGDPILHLDWPEGPRIQNSFNFLSLEASVGEPSGGVCMGYSCELPEGYEVIWASDLDGEIARGAYVEIFPEERTGLLALQMGTHVITVTVTDSFGNSVSQSGELTIR